MNIDKNIVIPKDMVASIYNPKIVAQVTICGSIHFNIDENMGWIEPTPEQIKNLHDAFCIDVKLMKGEI